MGFSQYRFNTDSAEYALYSHSTVNPQSSALFYIWSIPHKYIDICRVYLWEYNVSICRTRPRRIVQLPEHKRVRVFFAGMPFC